MSLKEKADAMPLMNEKIPFSRFQLITADGQNAGEVGKGQALALAEAAGLDLVIIADRGGMDLPVAKIMDFGKVAYAKKKQQHDAKKHQKVIQVKEVQMRPKIAEHDFLTKVNNGIKFLLDGKRLKIVLIFKGREVTMKEERGAELFGKIEAAFEEAGLQKRLVAEKDAKTTQMWSRVYYLK